MATYSIVVKEIREHVIHVKAKSEKEAGERAASVWERLDINNLTNEYLVDSDFEIDRDSIDKFED